MFKNRILTVGLAWVGAISLLLLFALVVQVGHSDAHAGGNWNLMPEKEGMAGNNFGPGVYPLFVGSDVATTLPNLLINVTDSSFITAFTDIDAWGAAYDPVGDQIYHNDGSTLYVWSVGGGAPTLLGTITDPTGTTVTIHGLAYYNGTLYGTSISTDIIYSIDPGTQVATPFITLVDTSASISGLAIDPTDGTFYGTDDLSNVGLVQINPDGTLTLIAAYLGGETDVDGLAISPSREAYLITDDNTPPYYNVYDLNAMAYTTVVTYPWSGSANQVSGAWIGVVTQVPGITLSKTVGTDPNTCAPTSNILVPVGTDVTYCYNVTNSGDITLTVHDLDDDMLGSILSGFPFSLTPGASVFVTQSANITMNTTNIATWTACNIDGPPTLTCSDGAAFDVVSDTATANVSVYIPPAPSIALTKTVGLDNSTCATTSNLMVGQPSTEVYYCYTVMNTGNVTFATHDLDDDKLGPILSNYPFVLGPGESTSVFPVTETITMAVTNVATWTAYVDTATWVTATASATVTEQPTDVSLNTFSGSSNTLALPAMFGLLVLLVFSAFSFIRRFQAKSS